MENEVKDTDRTPKLFAALAKCQAACGAATKSGNNKFDGYKYSMLEDYCAIIRKPMADNGLSISVEIAQMTRLPDRTTNGGKTEHAVEVSVIGTLAHESGETREYVCFGEGQDRADKAMYKAFTGAKKYLLSNIFNVPTTDDPEQDSKEELKEVAERKAPAARPASTPEKAPVAEPPKREPPLPMPPRDSSPIPGAADVNAKLAEDMTLNQAQFDELKAALTASKVPAKQWKMWLKDCYGFDGMSTIKRAAYAGILLFVKEKSEYITKYQPKAGA